MSILSAIPGLGTIVEKGLSIIDQLVTDKDQANKLKAEFELAMMKEDFSLVQTEIQAQAEIIASEAKGNSWVQRNWRPALMWVVIIIVANNYLLSPYLSLFWPDAPVLNMPDRLWNLLEIGVGGYVVGRSGEKIMTSYKKDCKCQK